MIIDLYKSRYFMPEGEAAGGAATEETEGDDIAAQAYAEMDGKESPKKKEPLEAEAEPAKEQPAKEEGEPQVHEGETAEEKSAREASEAAAGETPEAKAEREKKEADEKAAASVEPIAEEVIQAHAEKHGQTFAQAKEDLEAAQAVLAKYKDPLELARAHREQQREYDRLKSKSEVAVVTTPQLMTDAELKAEVDDYAVKNADRIVAKYKQDYPKRTETMDDEAILEWAKDDAIKNYRSTAGATIAKIQKEATDRRQTLLETIPKGDAKFMHDVKLILDNTPDRVILNPKYDVKGILWHAKGQRYDADIQAAYQRGLKAGKEEPKIVGRVGSSDTGAGKQGAKLPVQAGKITLNPQQKEAAYNYFPDSSEAKAEEMWADLFKEDIKKDKNYLPN